MGYLLGWVSAVEVQTSEGRINHRSDEYVDDHRNDVWHGVARERRFYGRALVLGAGGVEFGGGYRGEKLDVLCEEVRPSALLAIDRADDAYHLGALVS